MDTLFLHTRDCFGIGISIGIFNGQVSLPLLAGISKFSSSRTGEFSLVQSHYSEALD